MVPDFAVAEAELVRATLALRTNEESSVVLTLAQLETAVLFYASFLGIAHDGYQPTYETRLVWTVEVANVASLNASQSSLSRAIDAFPLLEDVYEEVQVADSGEYRASAPARGAELVGDSTRVHLRGVNSLDRGADGTLPKLSQQSVTCDFRLDLRFESVASSTTDTQREYAAWVSGRLVAGELRDITSGGNLCLDDIERLKMCDDLYLSYALGGALDRHQRQPSLAGRMLECLSTIQVEAGVAPVEVRDGLLRTADPLEMGELAIIDAFVSFGADLVARARLRAAAGEAQ